MNTFDGLPPTNAGFAATANACMPELYTIDQHARNIVEAKKDPTTTLGWSASVKGPVEDMQVLNSGDCVILDFGGHRTGYFSFNLVPYKHGMEPADSPARLRIVFGEILADVAEELEPYNAWLSKAWLPDEIINVDYLPQPVKIQRRHAFRYIRIDVLAVSARFGVKVEQPLAHAVSSAPRGNPASLSFTKRGQEFTEEKKNVLRKIDEVALLTLRNCMHTVYEDGPRRDMRLWIGDLRLQALANYATFRDTTLAKRCLYLFAATPLRDDGLLSASCYEKPHICSGGQSIVDFTQIYAAALLDYVQFSGDHTTGKELFPVALKQFELSIARCDSNNGLYKPVYDDMSGPSPVGGATWHFIDWHEELDKDTASHCVIIFGLKNVLKLSQVLSLPTPMIQTPFSDKPLKLPVIIDKLTQAARAHLYDASRGVFVSGRKKQISWASNAWAVMAGVPTDKEEAAHALEVAYKDAGSIIANTPYLHHYLCEAFIEAGLEDLATQHIVEYWGSMCDAGAETFWETWDPKKPKHSPYGDFHSNSFCHAWSCTPSLLLRRLGYE